MQVRGQPSLKLLKAVSRPCKSLVDGAVVQSHYEAGPLVLK